MNQLKRKGFSTLSNSRHILDQYEEKWEVPLLRNDFQLLFVPLSLHAFCSHFCRQFAWAIAPAIYYIGQFALLFRSWANVVHLADDFYNSCGFLFG